ncbi:hypothetical protein R3P38DRAFT_3169914 [Favolaschia claudopus]|uniref:Uncharacterized protein n=1 Tax=Favolaschia claudopus TaxID=2862362 RepID=A0AAW0DUY4_9AGAR
MRAEDCVLHRFGRGKQTTGCFQVDPLLTNVDPESSWIDWSNDLRSDPSILAKLFPKSAYNPDERAATNLFDSKSRRNQHAAEYSVSDTVGLVAISGARDPMRKLLSIAQERKWKALTPCICCIEKLARREKLKNPTFSKIKGDWNFVKDMKEIVEGVNMSESEDISDARHQIGEIYDNEEDEEERTGATTRTRTTTRGRGEDNDEEEEDNNDDDDEDKDKDGGDGDEDNNDGEEEDSDDSGDSEHAAMGDEELDTDEHRLDALKTNTPTSGLIKLFQAFLMAAFTEIDSTPGLRFHAVMEGFLFALNLHSDGTVQKALYALDFNDVGNCLDYLSRWFDPSQISAFARIRYYQSLGWSVVKNLPEFQFDSIKLSVTRWINSLHKLWAEAEEMLRTKLLFDQWDWDTLRKVVKDNPQNTSDGNGFALHDLESLDRIIKVLLSHKPFLDMFGRPKKFNIEALHSYCKMAGAFKELMFGLIHFCAPAKRAQRVPRCRKSADMSKSVCRERSGPPASCPALATLLWIDPASLVLQRPAQSWIGWIDQRGQIPVGHAAAAELGTM